MGKRLSQSLNKLVWRQVTEYWWIYGIALVCMAATHWLQSEIPFLAKEVGDLISEGKAGQIALQQFFWLALGILFFRTSSRILFFYPARVLEKDLRYELVCQLEETPPVRYRQQPSGQIYQVVFNDIMQVRALVGFAFLQICNVILACIIIIPKLVSFSIALLWAFIPLILSVLAFSYILKHFYPYYRTTQDLQGEVQHFIIEAYEGKNSIKNYRSEWSFLNLFKEYSHRELETFFKASVGNAISIPLVRLGTGFSFLVGAYLIKQQNLGATSLILFSGFVFLLLTPLSFLSWIGVVYSRSLASWKRVTELEQTLSQKSPLELQLETLNPPKKWDEETLRVQVPFWEQSLDLSIQVQTWSIFVGETGCGKTVLLENLASVLKRLDCELSYVAQSPYLYNDTIEANIFLGRTPTDLERQQALDFLKLLELESVSPLRQILKVEVGENGKKVSGGQAKRICLVRSLMSGSEVLLWDDPFSSVDVILEGVILDKLKPILADKTLIMTAHRLSTVRRCQNVFLLDKHLGVAEKGRVNQLLQQKSRVQEHFEKQMV